MSFASFNPSEFINNFEPKLSNERNPFLTPVSSSPVSTNQPECDKGIHRLPIHASIVHRLDEFITKNQIPHIIFHGPSGSGKQTLVREFIHRIYGGDRVKIKTHVMTVNCSHGKGIQFIREELKFFAKANAQTKSNVEGGKSSQFKVIVLLNAHHLTVDAQSALRRCIELFSYNTRFFIVVENKDKLLNPILSRFCDIFVPEPRVMENGPNINLHQYVLSQQFKGNQGSLLNPPFNVDNVVPESSLLNPPFNVDNVDKESSLQNPHFNVVPEGPLPTPPLQIKLLDKQLSDNFDTSSLTSLFRHIDHLYESGISCLDLMDHVKTQRDCWSEAEYSRAVMRFYQIKPQFRCEKLLMLFMINYLYRGK
jgi:hypothetical protein